MKLFIKDLRTKLVVGAEVVVPMITSTRQHQAELDFCINGHLPAVDLKRELVRSAFTTSLDIFGKILIHSLPVVICPHNLDKLVVGQI